MATLPTMAQLVAGAEAHLRIDIAEWMAERDPHWRSLRRDCLRDDIATLRHLREVRDLRAVQTFTIP